MKSLTTCVGFALLLIGCSEDPIMTMGKHDASIPDLAVSDSSAIPDMPNTGDMVRVPVGDAGCLSGEVCGNGLDDDCNGQIDDTCTCNLGTTQPCYEGGPLVNPMGACKRGTQTCAANGEFGAWGACTGSVHPTSEICDGEDNDCDGETDEGLVQNCYDGPDGTKGVGVCKGGTQTCVSGAWSSCAGEVLPGGQELCNDSTDDNCDGQLNEGCTVCSPQAAVFNLPVGTMGGPNCINTGGGTCEGTIYCDGGGNCSTWGSGCGSGHFHCGTLKCNDGTLTMPFECDVIGTCGGGGVTTTNWTW